GWVAQVDGAAVATYPTTNLGLLTFDVPPGEHAVRLAWEGTGVQQWAGLASLTALLLATGVAWRVGPRGLAAFPAILCAAGVVAILWDEPPARALMPTEPVETPSLRLAALRYEETDGSSLAIYPYWQTRERPSAELRVCWTLRGGAGQNAA